MRARPPRRTPLLGNTLLAQTVAHACAAAEIPWGHVSSGCIYAGGESWPTRRGKIRPEKDLMAPGARNLTIQHPERVHGFTETDTPNFSFRDGPCSFYSGTKALAEEVLAGVGRSYLWRLRIPFDDFVAGHCPAITLSKVQRYARVYDNINSVSASRRLRPRLRAGPLG